MTPAPYELTIYQGLDFRHKWRWLQSEDEDATPVDLSGYKFRAQVRVPSGTLTFDSEANDGSLVLGGEEGTIEMFADEEATELLKVSAGRWSLEFEPPGGDRDVLLLGGVVVVEGVTL